MDLVYNGATIGSEGIKGTPNLIECPACDEDATPKAPDAVAGVLNVLEEALDGLVLLEEDHAVGFYVIVYFFVGVYIYVCVLVQDLKIDTHNTIFASTYSVPEKLPPTKTRTTLPIKTHSVPSSETCAKPRTRRKKRQSRRPPDWTSNILVTPWAGSMMGKLSGSPMRILVEETFIVLWIIKGALDDVVEVGRRAIIVHEKEE